MDTTTLKIIIAIVCAMMMLAASLSHFEMDRRERVAWADGWQAYYIDSWAVGEYHRRVDALGDNRDPEARKAIWDEILLEAAEMEREWMSAHDSVKLQTIQGGPFWKRGVGQPRRLF
jgi:hypothetical protein